MGLRNTLTAHLDAARCWLFDPPEMPLVCEVAADYVSAVRQRHGEVESWAVRRLPPNAVRPGALTENLADARIVQDALEEVVGAVDGAARHCAVILPDATARVALLELDQLPKRASEVEGLVRWRLNQDLSFDLEQAQLSYQVQKPGAEGGGKTEIVAGVCLQHLLRQYEERFEALELSPGFVTLSVFATLGWFQPDESPRLVVKRARTSLSVTVLHRGVIRLFRSLPLTAASGDNGSGPDLFDKIFPALVYFKDREGVAVESASLCGLGSAAPALQARLQRDAGCEAVVLVPEETEVPPPALAESADPAWMVPAFGWVRAQRR